jgi:hypothetical protein
MAKHILAAAVMVSFLFLPVAIGDFVGATPAGAIPSVPEPGTLCLLTAGAVGMALSRWRRRR